MIDFSSTAIKKLKSLLIEEQTYDMCRIFIEDYGTSKAETYLTYCNEKDVKQDDIKIDLKEFILWVDKPSQVFLEGTKIDCDDNGNITIKSPKARKAILGKNNFNCLEDLKGHSFITKKSTPANIVPSGEEITLDIGVDLKVVQSMGASISVIYEGAMVRIARKNLSYLGVELNQDNKKNIKHQDEVSNSLVYELLKDCYDPEIPVNIVDLGLVYDCSITPLKKKKFLVDIEMTLTAVGCGMGDVIALDARDILEEHPQISKANVNLTFSPPWSQEMMSEKAKIELGMI